MVVLEDQQLIDVRSASWRDGVGASVVPPGENEWERTTADSALFRRFLEVRGRAREPVACVNSRFLFTNPAAALLIGFDDRDELWELARGTIDRGEHRLGVVPTKGREMEARCLPIMVGLRLVGAEVRLADQGPDGVRLAAPPVLGWGSLRDSELAIARLVADGLTNRQVGARLFLSRHTIDFHLRQIYRKLGISSRVSLTRLVLEHDGEEPAGAVSPPAA